jgi:biotin carboxyl carrier protein
VRRYTVTVDGTPFTIDVEETAADRFLVTVGERTFEAALASDEDLPGAEISPAVAVHEPAVPVPQPAAAPAAVRPARALPGTPVAAGGTGSDVLAAPMPGVVLEVNVAAGAVLQRGDPVLVLEAMKMRNTIRAPRDGVVTEVTTEAGRPVAPGEPLVRIGAATR